MSNLVKYLMYFARVVLIAIGGGVSLVKIVKGKSDENPKEMNEGLVTLAATGIIFAATFAITSIFS